MEVCHSEEHHVNRFSGHGVKLFQKPEKPLNTQAAFRALPRTPPPLFLPPFCRASF